MAAEQNIDTWVRAHFFPNPDYKGVLVDVGAAGPSFLSNSESFRKRGWKIIAIEPNPKFCKQHAKLGYSVLQYACSDEDKDDVNFYVVDLDNVPYKDGYVSYESFSSLGMPDAYRSALEELKHRINFKEATIKVNVRKLDTILAQHEPELGEIDIVSIDVEGWEREVVRGLSLERYKPKVLIMENYARTEEYRDFMLERGYWCWGQMGNNELYVRSEWQVPPT